jgi:hypothetical protein
MATAVFLALACGLPAARAAEAAAVKAEVKTPVPYHVAYDLEPFPFSVAVKPDKGAVDAVAVEYAIYDMYKNEFGRGTADLRLEGPGGAGKDFLFRPPRYCWYTVECRFVDKGEVLAAVGMHLGVTPKFPGMPAMERGQFDGFWNDNTRAAFCGLLLDRTNTNWGWERIAKVQDEADRCGVTLLVQFEGREKCSPPHVREMVSKLKGKVKFWEVWNEPNLAGPADKYAAVLKEAYETIKSIDRQAKVAAPACCGMNLKWYEDFYKSGGGKFCDIVSVHDYEGDESIDPGHWRWKIGELRKIMAAHGDADKELWQTERAIGGVRGKLFLGGVQAVRVTLQRDLWASMGTPGEHNSHYYLNTVGYGDVPTYVWSPTGPHPAALACRTRQAMTLGRKFTGTLDFGPTGNKILFALAYGGADGSTIVLRNCGTLDFAVDLAVRGASAVDVVDSWGNAEKVPVSGGRVSVKAGVMPVYVRLPRGAQAAPPKIDFGPNFAREAKFTFSGQTKSDFAILTNGLFEVVHGSSPWGKYWAGSLATVPQTLEMAFEKPREIARVLIFSQRADNPHCALLDYDLEYHNGKEWVAIEKVRAPCPPSDIVRTQDAQANTWYNDLNFFVHQFRPAKTDRLRIVALRSTLGFMPDETAAKGAGWKANSKMNLALREVEVYGPGAP